MADDVTYPVPEGTVQAADDISGKLYPRIKLIHGADGVNAGDVSASNPLPVEVADLPLPTGAATDAKLDEVITAIEGISPGGGGGGDVTGSVAHDASASSVDPVLTGGYASAASPSDVSADGDAVRAWHLRNGAYAVSITAAGALVGGDETNGLDVDVTRLPALPAGTNNIGDVDIASIAAGDNNIGNVDIVTVPSDPFGANGDAASASGSISAKLRFIASTGIPITGTVTVGSHAVTNAGTFATQVDGAALTALQLIDDPVATLGTTTYTEASTKGMIIGAVRRDADTTLVDTTNEVGPLQMDSNGRLKVEAFSGETLPVSLASVPSHAVTNAGTFATQVDGAALTALQLIDDIVYTDDTSTHATGTSKGALIMAAATPSDTAVNANDIGAVAMTLNRGLHVSVQDAIPAGTNTIGTVKTRFFSAAATTLTRPANTTDYAANDSISNNATAGSVTALSATLSDANDDPICITAVVVDTNDTGLAAGIQIRAYLYNSDPTANTGVVGGDNAAFSNKRAGFIGCLTGTMRAFSDGGKARLVPEEGNYIVTKPTSGAQTIFIQYQTLAAFTPSANSTTLIGTIEGFQGRA